MTSTGSSTAAAPRGAVSVGNARGADVSASAPGLWHDVELVLELQPDRSGLERLASELDPFATELRAEGAELRVRMLVPAGSSRAAADLAIDLVEAGICRSGGRLRLACADGSTGLEETTLAVSA